VFSLLAILGLFLMPLMSVGGEKYVKTDLCEIDLRECQIIDVDPFTFGVDENDRVYYFDDKKHDVVEFSKDCKIEKRIAVKKAFERSDFDFGSIKLGVRNGTAVIYPGWRGKFRHFINLNSGDQKTIEKETINDFKCTYFDEKIVNFQTGVVVQENPFLKPKGVRIGGQELVKEEYCGPECGGGCVSVFGLKGEKRRTKPYDDDCYYLIRVQTVDVNGNAYAIYKYIEYVKENGILEARNVKFRLRKFDNNLNVLFTWDGRCFFVNEETQTVYVLKQHDNAVKFEKWMLKD